LRQHAAEHYAKKDNWAVVAGLENPCALCYTNNSASGPDVSANCSVAIDGSKMVVACRYLDSVVRASVKRSSKHSERNPQSTNIAIKCPKCNEFKGSDFFKRDWKDHTSAVRVPCPVPWRSRSPSRS